MFTFTEEPKKQRLKIKIWNKITKDYTKIMRNYSGIQKQIVWPSNFQISLIY